MATRHNLLVALNRVITLYGIGREYRLRKHDKPNHTWSVLFEDKLTGSGWQTEYQGSFHECLDFIREYDREPDHPF